MQLHLADVHQEKHDISSAQQGRTPGNVVGEIIGMEARHPVRQLDEGPFHGGSRSLRPGWPSATCSGGGTWPLCPTRPAFASAVRSDRWRSNVGASDPGGDVEVGNCVRAKPRPRSQTHALGETCDIQRQPGDVTRPVDPQPTASPLSVPLPGHERPQARSSPGTSSRTDPRPRRPRPAPPPARTNREAVVSNSPTTLINTQPPPR